VTIRLGLQIPNFSYGAPVAELFPAVTAQAQEAEAAGFDTILVMDHFYQLPTLGEPDEPMLEAYTALGPGRRDCQSAHPRVHARGHHQGRRGAKAAGLRLMRVSNHMADLPTSGYLPTGASGERNAVTASGASMVATT
jgi:hypothetical protein